MIRRIWKAVSSLELAIVCLGALMVLVVGCTLAQTGQGTWGAVRTYMREPFVYWHVPGTVWSIPVFPGGPTVGAVLVLNLVAAQVARLRPTPAKAGLWLAHAGLVLLVAGEFVSGLMQVESRMAIEQGATADFVEADRVQELAIVDETDAAFDDVRAISGSMLRPDASVALPGTPLAVRVHRWVANAALARTQPGDPTATTSHGVGAEASLRELPPATGEEMDRPAAVVEPMAAGKSLGTWLVAAGLDARQTFVHSGRTYRMELRPRREYLPYAVTLKKFSHDKYAGTEIPKNFSSLLHLSDPQRGEDRDVLVSMNQPLRYRGKAFYQASFGRGDTLSILQVVENPGWLLPYVSCALVAAGLVLHFGLSLRRAGRRREKEVPA